MKLLMVALMSTLLSAAAASAEAPPLDYVAVPDRLQASRRHDVRQHLGRRHQQQGQHPGAQPRAASVDGVRRHRTIHPLARRRTVRSPAWAADRPRRQHLDHRRRRRTWSTRSVRTGGILLVLGVRGNRRRHGTPTATCGCSTSRTSLAFAANGDIFVTQGHGQRRAARAEVRPRRQFHQGLGQEGQRAGRVRHRRTRSRSTPRASSTSPTATTQRIQVFDADGNYVREFAPSGHPMRTVHQLRPAPVAGARPHRPGDQARSRRQGAGQSPARQGKAARQFGEAHYIAVSRKRRRVCRRHAELARAEVREKGALTGQPHDTWSPQTYSLHLSPEQLEIPRHGARLRRRRGQAGRHTLGAARRGRPQPAASRCCDKASQIGLRTLALPEDLGGVGADALTCLHRHRGAGGRRRRHRRGAVGDLGARPPACSTAMTPEQRERFLPAFLADDDYHLACAEREPGERYARSASTTSGPAVATRDGSPPQRLRSGGDFVINGVKDCVANAPIAKLFAVEADDRQGRGRSWCWCRPARTGLAVSEHGEPRWYHGACGQVAFEDCRVPADNLLGIGGPARRRPRRTARQALNLGIGRAAYEAALEYAQLRVQGGRPIIEHQAIGTKLADIAIRLEVARAARSGGRPGRPIIRRPTPTAACPTCRSPRSPRSFTVGGDLPGHQGRRRMLRRHGRDARHAAAEIHPRRAASACTPATATPTRGCASPRRWRTTGAARQPAARRRIGDTDHGLFAQQRAALLADDGAQVRARRRSSRSRSRSTSVPTRTARSTGTSSRRARSSASARWRCRRNTAAKAPITSPRRW